MCRNYITTSISVVTLRINDCTFLLTKWGNAYEKLHFRPLKNNII